MLALGAWIAAAIVRLAVLFVQSKLVHSAFLADRPKQPSENSLSIVVIFKEPNPELDALIQKITVQNYAGLWTLYLVHDCADEKSGVHDKWFAADPRIRFIQHAKYTAGKKGALAEVMSVIETDWVLFTDADCAPRSDQWITAMMEQTDSETDMVLGGSPFEDSVPDGWIHYDTLNIFLSYISWAILGRPYMSVGRNVLVRKMWWEDAGGVSRHLEKAGGDDDLTIQKANRRPRARYSISLDAQTITKAPDSLRVYINSKARHVSAGMSYTYFDQLALTALSVAQSMVIIGALSLVYIYPIPVIITSLFYLIMIHKIIRKWMTLLEFRWSPMQTLRSEMITPLLYAYIVLQAFRRNEKTW